MFLFYICNFYFEILIYKWCFFFQWSYFVAKKKVFLFYIYNFYFENLIYKWINQFENQQESDPIF